MHFKHSRSKLGGGGQMQLELDTISSKSTIWWVRLCSESSLLLDINDAYLLFNMSPPPPQITA